MSHLQCERATTSHQGGPPHPPRRGFYVGLLFLFWIQDGKDLGDLPMCFQ